MLADGHWWQRGPVQEVGGLFGLMTRTVCGDGATAEQVYDSDQLVVTAQLDALGLSTTSIVDYRVMAPARTTDPNGTTSSAVHDGFGRVVASGVEGPKNRVAAHRPQEPGCSPSARARGVMAWE